MYGALRAGFDLFASAFRDLAVAGVEPVGACPQVIVKLWFDIIEVRSQALQA
jgi:hypothetical protein